MNFKEKLFDTNFQNKVMLCILAFAGIYLALTQAALATGGDAEFGDIYQKLTDWAQGTLGKLLALICIVVGMAITVTRGSLIWAVIGFGMCLVLYNAPTIIDSLMDATISPTQTYEQFKGFVTNGLY